MSNIFKALAGKSTDTGTTREGWITIITAIEKSPTAGLGCYSRLDLLVNAIMEQTALDIARAKGVPVLAARGIMGAQSGKVVNVSDVPENGVLDLKVKA